MPEIDTKWIFHSVTNFSFFNYLLIDVALGCSQHVIPQQILRNRNIKCLLSDRNNRPFDDNLFLLRAVAYEIYGAERYLTETYNLFSQSIDKSQLEMNGFLGVNHTQISIVEELVHCNIQLYSLIIEGETLCCEMTYKTKHNFSRTVPLLKIDYNNCWTNDINMLLKRFRCSICDVFSLDQTIFNDISQVVVNPLIISVYLDRVE